MIIASRVLSLVDGSRKILVPIEIFAPTKEKDGAWSCRYEIGWPEGRRSFAGWGADSAQALVLTLGMIGAELYSSEHHKSGRLILDKPGNGYGFPLPPNLRDLLQGDDAKFL